jgi:hypothetical protein
MAITKKRLNNWSNFICKSAVGEMVRHFHDQPGRYPEYEEICPPGGHWRRSRYLVTVSLPSVPRGAPASSPLQALRNWCSRACPAVGTARRSKAGAFRNFGFQTFGLLEMASESDDTQDRRLYVLVSGLPWVQTTSRSISALDKYAECEIVRRWILWA